MSKRVKTDLMRLSSPKGRKPRNLKSCHPYCPTMESLKKPLATKKPEYDWDEWCWITIVAMFFLVPVTILLCLLIYSHDNSSTVVAPAPPSVESLSVTPIDIGFNSTTITAEWNLTLSIRNPYKKMTMYHHAVTATMFYKDVVLSSATLPSFYLTQGDQTALEARFWTGVVHVDEWVEDALVADLTRRGAVEFNLKVEAKVLIKRLLIFT
ncbi:hypothetical protein RJ640_009654 [Escallonia rubra]|uniref:Late embryogenesis abundant protein LEA-2 subgroup domain-containing protein n=1 Tax=Escallonia rubra TaxID=112253 RepID=A0AA88UWJ8_9ASTE|nr:hypothetical protein RJ640_009654 [Escallonia rubra]